MKEGIFGLGRAICATMFITVLLVAPIEAKKIATHGDLTAHASDTSDPCQSYVTIDAPSSASFSDPAERVNLERLLGTIRIAWEFECPGASKIRLVGYGNNKPVYEGIAYDAEGWILRDIVVPKEASNEDATPSVASASITDFPNSDTRESLAEMSHDPPSFSSINPMEGYRPPNTEEGEPGHALWVSQEKDKQRQKQRNMALRIWDHAECQGVFCDLSGGLYLNAIYRNDIELIKKLDRIVNVSGKTSKGEDQSILDSLTVQYMYNYSQNSYRKDVIRKKFTYTTPEYEKWTGSLYIGKGGGETFATWWEVPSKFLSLCDIFCRYGGPSPLHSFSKSELGTNPYHETISGGVEIRENEEKSFVKPFLSQFEQNLVSLTEKFLANKSSWVDHDIADLSLADKKLDNKAILTHNKNIPGMVMAPSGLLYRLIEPGVGLHPQPHDVVTVNEVCRLMDSTVARYGENYTTSLTKEIPGWSEGVQLLKPGGTIILAIPPELGYGDRDVGAVPAASILSCQTTLIRISTEAEAREAEMQRRVEKNQQAAEKRTQEERRELEKRAQEEVRKANEDFVKWVYATMGAMQQRYTRAQSPQELGEISNNLHEFQKQSEVKWGEFSDRLQSAASPEETLAITKEIQQFIQSESISKEEKPKGSLLPERILDMAAGWRGIINNHVVELVLWPEPDTKNSVYGYMYSSTHDCLMQARAYQSEGKNLFGFNGAGIYLRANNCKVALPAKQTPNFQGDGYFKLEDLPDSFNGSFPYLNFDDFFTSDNKNMAVIKFVHSPISPKMFEIISTYQARFIQKPTKEFLSKIPVAGPNVEDKKDTAMSIPDNMAE
jgi:FKBP-type peptidyl-prolyl cis-trans isomerase